MCQKLKFPPSTALTYRSWVLYSSRCSGQNLVSSLTFLFLFPISSLTWVQQTLLHPSPCSYLAQASSPNHCSSLRLFALQPGLSRAARVSPLNCDSGNLSLWLPTVVSEKVRGSDSLRPFLIRPPVTSQTPSSTFLSLSCWPLSIPGSCLPQDHGTNSLLLPHLLSCYFLSCCVFTPHDLRTFVLAASTPSNALSPDSCLTGFLASFRSFLKCLLSVRLSLLFFFKLSIPFDISYCGYHHLATIWFTYLS